MGSGGMVVWEKAGRDMALNLSELALCSGYSRSELTEMRHEGLLLFHGKITYKKAGQWRRVGLAYGSKLECLETG